MEPVVGTNGILIPPDGYMQAVRERCDRHGILLIADEVMSGFGRTGRWFAVDHWRVVPDIITMAKGLTSAYVPLGAVGVRPAIAAAFQARAFPGGLTYNSHPLACAAALATLDVYEHEDLIARAAAMGALLKTRLEDLARRHPSVGAVRSIGLFGLVELVRNRDPYEPMAPYNGTSSRDDGARPVLPRAGPVHVRPLEHVLHEPAAGHHGGGTGRSDRHHRSGARDHGPRHMNTITHWINGAPWTGEVERWGEVHDPATGQVTGRVAYADAAVVDAAVAAAARAALSWRETSLAVRTRIMFAYRERVERHKRDIAEILTREHGKVLSDALGEVNRGIEVLDFACGLAQLLKGEFSENVSSDVDSFSIRQPLGVVAGITPFNFPAMVPMWMYPLAMACGNAFILKPSEKNPSTSAFCAALLADAGLPDGVFSIVHGDAVAVDALLAHPDVQAISFVGSTPVARHVYETGTRAGKRVQALGGAKNHMVILPDADLALAADSAVSAAYGSTGQRCMAVSVLVCVGAVADRLLPGIRARIGRLKVAPGLEPGAEMGPLCTREHAHRVRSYIEQGVAAGASLVVDGRALTVAGHEDGFFLGPCLFDRVTPDMSIYQDEIFGPVLSIVRVATYEEAVALVNQNRWANGVALFTNDGGAARRFQHEVQVGMVGINVPIPVPMAYYSFGGWKQSLFGDAHVHGREGVHFYTRGKVVTARWPDPAHRGVNLGFPQMT